MSNSDDTRNRQFSEATREQLEDLLRLERETLKLLVGSGKISALELVNARNLAKMILASEIKDDPPKNGL